MLSRRLRLFIFKALRLRVTVSRTLITFVTWIGEKCRRRRALATIDDLFQDFCGKLEHV